MTCHTKKALNRLPRRTAFVSTPGGPEPRLAPAALYGERPGRVYTLGPLLAFSADRGVCLFQDLGETAPAPEPAADRPVYPPIREIPLWVLALQFALLLGALAWSAVVVTPGAGQ